jgi:hypothetical protein
VARARHDDECEADRRQADEQPFERSEAGERCHARWRSATDECRGDLETRRLSIA